MKIRLSEGSIRFRLSQSEVQTLVEQRTLRETVQMGIQASRRFIFEVHHADALEQMSFQQEGNTIRALLPQSWITKWKTQISFEMKQPLSKGFLKVIVERDLE